MASAQDLNRRITSFGNMRKVTRAMEMVSAAKLRRAQQRIETLRPFANSILEITALVANGIQAASPHPLLAERETKRVCLLMFTGDRGLAGALNANVLRRSLQLEQEWTQRGAEVRWIAVGKKGASSLTFRKFEIDKTFRGITDWPTFRAAEEIGQAVIERFTAQDYDKVVLIYNHFDSAMSQTVIVQDLLPLTDDLLALALGKIKNIRDLALTQETALVTNLGIKEGFKREKESESKHKADWIFEPDPQELLDRLLPTYIEQTCFRALLESTASEHGSRMTAMKSASDNAADLIDELTLLRNRVRQAAITQEILEVVAGADAL